MRALLGGLMVSALALASISTANAAQEPLKDIKSPFVRSGPAVVDAKTAGILSCSKAALCSKAVVDSKFAGKVESAKKAPALNLNAPKSAK